MVGHQTLNLAIGVRVPASQPLIPSSHLTTTVTSTNTLPLWQLNASNSLRQLIASNFRKSTNYPKFLRKIVTRWALHVFLQF